MISLRSYLSRDTEVETTYRRVIGLFLQGISLHSVEGDKADYDRFREDIRLFKMPCCPLARNAGCGITGSGWGSAPGYGRLQSARRSFWPRQNTELQHMVSMLTKTIITIGASSETSVNRLQSIEKSIESTEKVEDIPDPEATSRRVFGSCSRPDRKGSREMAGTRWRI